MPRINREFRTLIGPENTFALGSSMGSLLSYYLVKNHPDAFGKDIAGGDTVPAGARLFFDYGTETLDSSYEEDHEPVRQWFLEQGLVEGRDFRFEKYEGADHSERAWRARVGDQLEWLLGGG
jgi:enterochelin esterase-like enzyme